MSKLFSNLHLHAAWFLTKSSQNDLWWWLSHEHVRFRFNKRSDIVFIDRRSKFEDYQGMMGKNSLNLGVQIGGTFMIFQQDLDATYNTNSVLG